MNTNTHSINRPKPIILVPSEAIEGNLNLSNAESFLKNEQYILPESSDGSRLEVYLKIMDREVSFEIWDNFYSL